MRQYMKNGHILTVHNPVQSQDNVFSAKCFSYFVKKHVMAYLTFE